MLLNLRLHLQATFARIVGNLLEHASRRRKTGKARHAVFLSGPEPLERRITPAAYNWIATTPKQWDDPSAWQDMNGAHVVPPPDSDIYFGPWTGDCTMSISGGVAVNSLTIDGTYGSSKLILNTTIDVRDSMSIAGGNIVQPNGAASAITCEGPLFWSGGNIGSQTGSTSTLDVYNTEATGTSVISGGTQKNLGDNFNLDGGTLNLSGDTGNQVIVNNNANISNYGEIDLNAGAKGITNASDSSGSLLNMNSRLVHAWGTTGGQNLQCIPIVNQGYVYVGSPSKTVTVLEINGTNSQNGVSFMNNGGTTRIYAGANLLAQSGFTQQAGTLAIAGGGTSNLNMNALSSAAATVNINGGYISFDDPADVLRTGYDFTMSGGTLPITVDATAQTWNQILSYAGNVTITAGVTKKVNTINIPQTGMPNGEWNIFLANAGNLFGSNAIVTVVNPNLWQWNGYMYGTGGNNSPTFYLVSPPGGGGAGGPSAPQTATGNSNSTTVSSAAPSAVGDPLLNSAQLAIALDRREHH